MPEGRELGDPAGLSFAALVERCRARVDEVLPWDLAERLEHGGLPLLLDVREPYEFAAMHIAGSLSVQYRALRSLPCPVSSYALLPLRLAYRLLPRRVRRRVNRGRHQPDGDENAPFATHHLRARLKTLAVRMERHNENGQAFAEWAATHARINAVHYPGLPEHPDHEAAGATLDGFGGMVGIEVAGGAAGASKVLRRLRVAQHAPSLGGVETLVSEPRLTSHADLTTAQRAAQGIPDGFIRVSLGIEDVEDLIADFKRALSGA